MFSPKEIPALRELSERITALEQAESERERVVTEQLRQLALFWKRIRQREAYDKREQEEEKSFDERTARTVLALKLRNVNGGS